MLGDRTVEMKRKLFTKMACLSPDNKAFLLASIVAIVYETATERTKDLIDDKIVNYGAGVKKNGQGATR